MNFEETVLLGALNAVLSGRELSPAAEHTEESLVDCGLAARSGGKLRLTATGLEMLGRLRHHVSKEST